MHLIKLDATESTNGYLKDLLATDELDDLTIVVAYGQSHGKGQRDASWESDPGKNLTFSILKKFESLAVHDGFALNVCVSLAVSNALKRFSIPDLFVKWPNDILSGNTKICGILIENLLIGKQIRSSIIGIGLNVNQTSFHTVSNATAMKLLLGRTLNLDEVMNCILAELALLFSQLKKGALATLKIRYEQELFRKDRVSTFKDPKGIYFMGIIRGVSSNGRLRVELEDAVIKEFDLKELKLMY